MANTIVFPISLPKAMADAIDRLAAKAMMTRSEYVRHQIRSSTAWQALDELRQVAVPAAKQASIHNTNDVVRLIRADRKQRNHKHHRTT